MESNLIGRGGTIHCGSKGQMMARSAEPMGGGVHGGVSGGVGVTLAATGGTAMGTGPGSAGTTVRSDPGAEAVRGPRSGSNSRAAWTRWAHPAALKGCGLGSGDV